MSDAITTYEGLAALYKTNTLVWGMVEHLDCGEPAPLECGVVGQIAYGYLTIEGDDSDRDLTIYRDATRRRLWFYHEEAPARAKHDEVCRAWLARRREEDIKALRDAGWKGTP